MRRGLSAPARAGLVAMAVLAAAEGAARFTLGRVPLPDSREARRNTTHQRGFVDYTRPRARPAGERLVIVLSNSQGQVGRGARDPGPGLFPALLERRLGEGTRVLNWSVMGGDGAELAVLAARAGQHRPDAVLLVAGGLNFNGDLGIQPLSRTGSDVEHLAYLPEVRRNLPERFLRRHAVHEPQGWLSAHSGLVRWRHRFVEQRASNWEPTDPGRPDRRFQADLASGRIAPGKPGRRSEPPWREEGVALLQDLREALRAGAPDARLVVASQPVCWFAWDAASQEPILGLSTAAERLFAGDRLVRVVDLTRSVAPRDFLSVSHLEPAGHRALADLLLPHARWALGE